MATQVRMETFPVSNLPKRVVQADGIFQIGVGVVLLLEASSIAGWLNVSGEVILIAAVIALVSGLATLYLAQRPLNPRLLRIGALTNLAGVVIVGIILALDWNGFVNEGRWFLALLADGFLILGVAEWYGQRYLPH